MNPFLLSMATFEDLSNDKVLKVWDHSKGHQISLTLNEDLYQELLFFKCYLNRFKEEESKEQRVALDGTVIQGSFIFSCKASAMYDRFKNRYSRLILNLKLTPKDLIAKSVNDRKLKK